MGIMMRESQDYSVVVKTDIPRHPTFSALVSCDSPTALTNEEVRDQPLLTGMQTLAGLPAAKCH